MSGEQPDGERETDVDGAGDGEVNNPASRLRPLKPGGEGSVWYAYIYLTLLILGPLTALALAVWGGYITPDITLTVQANLGTPVEWLAIGLVAVFLVWTFVQVVRVTGVGFISGLVGAFARIAHNYELPQDADLSQEQSGDQDE